MSPTRVVTTLTALGLLGCGGTVVFEEPGLDGSGGAGGGAGLSSSSASVTATAGSAATTTSGASTSAGGEGGGVSASSSGSGGGGDPLLAACERFCEAHGVPCGTFEGDCVRDCSSVVQTFGCEPEWIDAIACIARGEVTCEDVGACSEAIDRWDACIEG